jgi:hypothetical protein
MNRYINDNVMPYNGNNEHVQVATNACPTHGKSTTTKDTSDTRTTDKTVSAPKTPVDVEQWMNSEPSSNAVELLRHVLTCATRRIDLRVDCSLAVVATHENSLPVSR